MTRSGMRGLIFRCPICQAEITVLAGEVGDFVPRCCNTNMLDTGRRIEFYRCPVCGSEIGIIHRGDGRFEPRCCNTGMQRLAA